MESQSGARKGKQRTPPVQQEFLFVDASKSATGASQGRRNARAFVMQKARRERPWSTSKHAAKQRRSPEMTSPTTINTPELSHTPITSTPSPPTATFGNEYCTVMDPNHISVMKQETCSNCHFFRCRPGQRLCPRCLVLQPQDLESGLFDPFGTGSVDMDGEVTQLLRYFVIEMAPVTIAVDFRRKSNLMKSDWFGTTLGNAGFMHSLLCTTALHRYICGRGPIDTIYYHRIQAIAAINCTIESSDWWSGISDANIGAVFNLLSVEESLPFIEPNRQEERHTDQREVHFKGLLRMIELRGGLKAINSNRILHAFILWHSTAHAIASFEAPYLSAIDYGNPASFLRHPRGYRPNFSNHLLDYCRKAQIKETLTTLVESALVLVADLNVWFDDINNPLDPLDIQNFSCVLECSLLQWLRENNGHHSSPIEDALCVALLIFTVRTTEALQRHAGHHHLHFIASKRLEKALSATSQCEWTYCPELLLWILTIGAISAEGSDDSSWFVFQTSLACIKFGIQTAEALLERLHLCGWVSFKLDKAVCYLWERIITLRLSFASDSNAEHPENTLGSYESDIMAGPLQTQVQEFDFEGWQSIDWGELSNEIYTPGGLGLRSLELGSEDETLETGAGYSLYHNDPLYALKLGREASRCRH